MGKKKFRRIFVEGAGLVGPCYAALFENDADEIIIFEKRPYADCCRTYGKSINLGISFKGWNLFNHLGYTEKIQKLIVPMRGRMIHGLTDVNKRSIQSYGYYENGKEQTLDSVSRLGLSLLLTELAQRHSNVKFLFSVGVEKVDLSSKNRKLVLSTGEVIEVGKDDLVIASGGVNSQIRKSLQEQHLITGITGGRIMLNYSYIEIEKNLGTGYPVPPNYLHIWPRGQQMFAALPNPGGTLTGAVYAPQSGTMSFNDIYSVGSRRFFEENFSTLLKFIPNLIEQFDAGKPSQLSEVRLSKWHFENFVIVGDAAHALVPFLGQGMNFSMYLALKLFGLLKEHSTTEAALNEFEKYRSDANLLANWSEKNFHEMSGTHNPELQLRKEIEEQLEINFPKFASFHTKACFREGLDYADIEKQTLESDVVFTNVLKLPNVFTDWKTTLWPQIVSMMVPA